MSDISGTGRKITLEDLRLNYPSSQNNVKVLNSLKLENEISQIKTTDSKEIKSKTSKQEPIKTLSFVDEPSSKTPVKATESTPSGSRPTNINTKEVFHKTDIATAKDIDKILTRYNSPHAGKGQVILDACKKNNINPILVLAVMQEESIFGSKKLKEENQANPFSVHFNESAKGIKKLRLKDGSLPTFEQSLNAGIKTILRHAKDSPTPLSTAAVKYCETPGWDKRVEGHYRTLLKRY
ncbi:MAG: hypothetical protein ACK4IX_03645 [Candidatus Sericytochromatia bacterium]